MNRVKLPAEVYFDLPIGAVRHELPFHTPLAVFLKHTLFLYSAVSALHIRAYCASQRWTGPGPSSTNLGRRLRFPVKVAGYPCHDLLSAFVNRQICGRQRVGSFGMTTSVHSAEKSRCTTPMVIVWWPKLHIPNTTASMQPSQHHHQNGAVHHPSIRPTRKITFRPSGPPREPNAVLPTPGPAL